ncbi:MAG: spore germination protein [Eubacterium sp.]|nr:spore germination protein [Eubacterium sp.]
MNNNIGDKMKYLTKSYEMNRDIFKSDFTDCSDFLLREIVISGQRGFFCTFDGLTDSLMLSHMITSPILSTEVEASSPDERFEKIKKSVIGSVEMNEVNTFEECRFYLMSGFALFYLEGCYKALAMGVQGWSKRTTDEPTNEAMVKGAKECFVETLNDNKALLRKRLKTYHLKLKQINLGTSVSTCVVLAYMDNRVNFDSLKEIEDRLKSADLNTISDFGCLEPFINSDINSFFSTVGNTERPDVLASKLLEGRIGIIVDGTPFVIYTPYLFSDNFSSLDDYDNPPFYASFTRILKYLAFFISIFLPAMYVAVGSFHQEMIPTTLLYVIASSEATTPFSLVLEAVIIHILYEIMREAGLRLPQTIGHAVSIIGAIVIGEAMVSAGIIGEPMLVIVALTAIASYVVYPLYESVAVLRILFILLAGVSGMYGLIIGAGALGVNICALNNLGVPYSAPISPLTPSSIGDTIFRQGWKKLSKRRVRIYDLEGSSVENRS